MSMEGNGKRRLEIPGVPGLRPATQAEQMAAAIIQLDHKVNLLSNIINQLFQFEARVAIGWDPAECIRDMKLNVDPIPVRQKVREKRAETREEGEAS